VTAPTDYPFSELDQAREELREGLENSRELVRQSRVLIELTESDKAWLGDEERSAVN
jgi:hypothetical protein